MEKETKFTKGPWEVKREHSQSEDTHIQSDTWRITSTNAIALANCMGLVCAVSLQQPQCKPKLVEEIEANANLIAAAPDMYEALVIAGKAMTKLNDRLSEMGKGLADGYGTPFDTVCTAIAKARGAQ